MASGLSFLHKGRSGRKQVDEDAWILVLRSFRLTQRVALLHHRAPPLVPSKQPPRHLLSSIPLVHRTSFVLNRIAHQQVAR